jgi:hypothetical protein
MPRRHFSGGFSAGVNWTQWTIGIWWWPIKKDRAFGILVGPFYLQWERRYLIDPPR